MVKEGNKVKNFNLLDFLGNEHSLSKYLGKRLLFIFILKIILQVVQLKLVTLEIIMNILKKMTLCY